MMRTYIKSTAALLAAVLVIAPTASPALHTAAASPGAVFASKPISAPIRITLNGKTLNHNAMTGSDGVLVPLAAIRDELGLKLSYDAKTKSYQITRGKIGVQLTPSEFQTVQIKVNGGTQFSDYEWVNQNGHNYVSVHLLSDVLGYRTEWNNTSKTVNLVPLQLNDIKVTAKLLSDSTKVTDFQMQYPEISGLDNKSAQQKINQMFKDRAEAYLQDSKERSAEFDLGPQGAKNEYDMYYSVTYNRNGYISFRMLNYEYTGGAHGMSALEGITLRLSDGKQMELSDLLKDNPNYLKVIDQKAAANLKKAPGYFDNFVTAGEKPDFYLKEGGIVVFFQLYEYLPYAAGFPEYYIPFSALLPKGSNPLEQK